MYLPMSLISLNLPIRYQYLPQNFLHSLVLRAPKRYFCRFPFTGTNTNQVQGENQFLFFTDTFHKLYNINWQLLQRILFYKQLVVRKVPGIHKIHIYPHKPWVFTALYCFW